MNGPYLVVPEMSGQRAILGTPKRTIVVTNHPLLLGRKWFLKLYRNAKVDTSKQKTAPNASLKSCLLTGQAFGGQVHQHLRHTVMSQQFWVLAYGLSKRYRTPAIGWIHYGLYFVATVRLATVRKTATTRVCAGRPSGIARSLHSNRLRSRKFVCISMDVAGCAFRHLKEKTAHAATYFRTRTWGELSNYIQAKQ